MHKLLDLADRRAVETFVRRIEPAAKMVTVLEHSYHNVIVVVDEAKVFRFPRTQAAAVHQRYEVEVLRQLRGKLTLPIPEVLDVHDEPSYVVVSFLRGWHLSLKQLRRLDASSMQEVAGQFAAFIAEMAQAITPGSLQTLRTAHGLDDEAVDELWPVYVERVLYKADFPGQPWLKQVARKYYAEWQAMQARSELTLQGVHDDLHNENILFHGAKITGMLDFGLTNIGTAAQEMRQLYRVGDELVRATIDVYEHLSGEHVRFEDVRTWAITAELASYCHRLSRGETGHPSFLRTGNNLRRWLPEFREHNSEVQIKAIIFDCFGVLASDGLRPFRQKYLGRHPALMRRAVHMGRQVDAGHKNYDDFVRELAGMAAVPEQTARQQIENNVPDAALFAYIRGTLKPHYKIGLLSNAGDNWLDEIFAPEQVALFDAVALSYQTGFVKPDPRAYRHIAERLQVSPSACVFVDDQPRYLAGAQAVGMQTIQYKNFDQFASELDNLLQRSASYTD